MSELRPTTKAERKLMVYEHLGRDEVDSTVMRLAADIERRDAILRRLVEWEDDDWSGPEHVGADGDGPLEVLDTIIADARKELDEGSQS